MRDTLRKSASPRIVYHKIPICQHLLRKKLRKFLPKAARGKISDTRFNEEKWNEMISSGLTLGEILYENDEEYKSRLDVELNKNNRVTAAQFASIEAIANTPRSPRFFFIIAF